MITLKNCLVFISGSRPSSSSSNRDNNKPSSDQNHLRKVANRQQRSPNFCIPDRSCVPRGKITILIIIEFSVRVPTYMRSNLDQQGSFEGRKLKVKVLGGCWINKLWVAAKRLQSIAASIKNADVSQLIVYSVSSFSLSVICFYNFLSLSASTTKQNANNCFLKYIHTLVNVIRTLLWNQVEKQSHHHLYSHRK